MASRWRVRWQVRERKRGARLHDETIVVVCPDGAKSWDAIEQAKGRASKSGLVVGLIYGAVRLGPATVDQELRGRGVPGLFDGVAK